jgi:hypothetical protein
MIETTTATEMAVVVSPDISITKTEKFNSSRLAQLLNNPSTTADDRTILRAIKSGTRNLCYFDVTYKLGKSVKMEAIGRYYPIKGGGQSLSRDIRAALYGEFYHDVDIVNAQPTILTQYCDKNGWKCDALKDYVQHRDERMKEAHEFMGGDRAEIKQKINQIIFGGSADGMPEFCLALHKELSQIRQNVWDRNKDKFKSLAKKPNFLRSAMAHVLQTEECKCLLAMDRSLSKRGYSLDVLIHDGGLVAKKDDAEIPDDILRAVEDDIKKITDYTIRLAVKPMNTTIQFQDEKDEYLAWKTEFEKTHFRLQIPQCFIWLHERGFEQLCLNQLHHLEGQAKMSDGKPFLAKWLTDETMLTYNRLVFCPKQEPPPNCFNIFDRFGNIATEGNFSAFTELVGLVSNHDHAVEEFLHNLFAHMVQKPYQKSGICVCLLGPQGVGKSLLMQKVGKIFGSSHYYETSAPQNNVFHNFNSGTERTIMLFMDEVDFKTNKANASKLKTLITSEKEIYTKKGHDGVELDDFRNVFMATNGMLPFIVEDTDRRFCAIECSEERRGQHEWWAEMVKRLDDQVSAYHHFLLTRDISTFNPRRDRPETEAYRDIKQMTSIPYHAGFFQKVVTEILCRAELMETTEIPMKSWKAKQLHEEMNEFVGEKFELSPTRLGIDMRKVYVGDGGVNVEKGRLYNIYTLNAEKCMEFLKEKGWWVE